MPPVLPDHFAAPEEPVDLLVVVGEHSGDQHAARLIRRLREISPALRVSALGGEALRESGCQLLFDTTRFSAVGLFEVLRHYGFFRRFFQCTTDWITKHQPKAVLLVDYPGFNLRLARWMKESGQSCAGGGRLRCLFYIGPQIWAWKAGRRFKMAQWLDALGVIFPFEVSCYADTNLSVSFVGHPFAEADYVSPVTYAPNDTVLLLPGSRPGPVKRIYPVLLAAAQALRSRRPGVRFCTLYPGESIRELLEEMRIRHAPDLAVEASGGGGIKAAAVLTSSGTMSLHCALSGIPGAIVYRANPMTYVLGRLVVKIPYLGMANLLLQRPAWPEYLQGDAKPERLAAEVEACLDDADRPVQAAKDARALLALLSPQSGETSVNAHSAARWLQEVMRS